MRPYICCAARLGAASDEIEHAALSFGLAAAYQPDRKVVGPGSLPSFASTPAATHPAAATATDLARVALSAARDGGVHETIAAIEAMLAYHCASEPAVVSALNIISEDEARHAVLSWEVIEYAVGVDPSLAPLIAESIEEALRVMVVGRRKWSDTLAESGRARRRRRPSCDMRASSRRRSVPGRAMSRLSV